MLRKLFKLKKGCNWSSSLDLDLQLHFAWNLFTRNLINKWKSAYCLKDNEDQGLFSFQFHVEKVLISTRTIANHVLLERIRIKKEEPHAILAQKEKALLELVLQA